ncbi:MAG: DNA primase family protein [Bacillota bacterium]
MIVCEGSSCFAKHWWERVFDWENFKDKLRETRRSNETVAEFKNMSKDEQLKVKDCGGFVLGKLKNGIRKKGFVEERHALSFDADNAKPDFIIKATALGFIGCIYSTHSHSKDKPRFRLIYPLSRPITEDEYEPVARMVAWDLGIEQFDKTTFEAIRLMFYPSTSADGEYVFEEFGSELLDPDNLLSRYRDWRNVSEWPMVPDEKEIIQRSLKKQADPLSKEGLVGAFCRAYDIEDAISAFLPDVYEQCDHMPGRYTYIGGSTFGGVVIYDGKFSYSHHATDPASGRLCNSFDLVRIHKFGALDEDAKEGTPAVKMPSYIEMKKLAEADEGVRNLLQQERLDAARQDFVIPTKAFFENKKFVPKFLAQWFLDRHKACIINGDLYVYENGRYVPGEALFMLETTEVLSNEFSTHRQKEALSYIRNTLEKVPPDVATSTGKFINVLNGLLDLDTFELMPHDPELKTVIQIPVEYRRDASCPAIEEFINMVAPEYADTLFEIVGYALQPSMWIEKSFLFKGPGKNGKGTFLAILHKFFGKANVSNVSLHALSENRFLAAELFGKLVNLHADLPKRLIDDTSTFKELTSGDPILAERKYEQPFSFHNRAKLLFSTNELSPTKDNSEGYYRKWLILPFEKTFNDNELRSRLFEDDEMSGLLLKALEGLQRIRRQNDFTTPKSLIQMKEEYRSLSDSAYHFIKEYCFEEKGTLIKRQDLYDEYRNCCKDWGCIAVSQKNFNAKILEQFKGVKLDKNNGRRWKGINVLSDNTFMAVERCRKAE